MYQPLRKLLIGGLFGLLLATFINTAAASDPSTALGLNFAKKDVIVAVGIKTGVSVSTSPASIESGIDCGMAEMCGLDPCTCGSSDDYGHCSCNGTKQVCPTFTVTSSDRRVATAVYQKGKLVICGVSRGTASITVHAELAHYSGTQQTLSVTVTPSPVPYIVIGAGVVAIAVAVFILWRRRRHASKKEASP